MEKIQMSSLRLDDLNLGGLKIYQYTDLYCFTSDSVLLANFVKVGHKDECVEIGAGSGIISILVNYKLKPQKIFAFEMQEKMSDLCKKNIEYNSMQQQIEVINDKVQNYATYFKNNKFDVVFCNPPYYKKEGCVESAKEEILKSKHEKFLPLNELALYASKMLKFGGKFYIVYPASRLSELIYSLKKNKLEPKKLFFAQPNENKNASTVYVECIKNGKEGTVVLPTLLTNNLSGDYVQTIQKLYRDVKGE